MQGDQNGTFRKGPRIFGGLPGRPEGSKQTRPRAACVTGIRSTPAAQTVILTENGKRRKMAKRQALAKQLVNKALSNDPKAAALVLDQTE